MTEGGTGVVREDEERLTDFRLSSFCSSSENTL